MGVVLEFHVSKTFRAPVPVRVCDTLLSPLVKVIVPESGPGEPEAGANVTLNVWIRPAGIVKGNVGKPEIEKAAPERFAAVTVTAAPVAVTVPVWGELLVPSGTDPKFRLAGETLRPACCDHESPLTSRIAAKTPIRRLIKQNSDQIEANCVPMQRGEKT